MTVRSLTMLCAGLMCLVSVNARTSGEDHNPQVSTKPQETENVDQNSTLDRSASDRASDPTRSTRQTSDFTPSDENRKDGIGKSNKACSLIGMEVRNQQNEKLGDIKDMVIDLPSGQVSYVVLSTGGFLGFGDRLVAIPPSAFQRSADPDFIVIIADKQKIMNAPSFSKANWPDPKSANFEAYWASDREAVGAPSVGVSAGSASGQSEYRRDTDRPADRISHRTQSRYSKDRSSADTHAFRGKIVAINPEARTMTVEGEDGATRDFIFTERPTLDLKSNRNPHLIDYKVGHPVSVGYFEEGDGKYMARSLMRIDAP